MVQKAWRRATVERYLVVAANQIWLDLIKKKATLASTSLNLNNKAKISNEISQKVLTAKTLIKNGFNAVEAE